MAPQDYTRRSFQAAAALIAVLVCVAFIPPQTICGIPLRRANILSDVLRFDDKEAADETLPELDDEFSGDFHRFAGQLDAGEAPLPADSIAAEPPAADTLSTAPQLAFEWTPADSEPPTEPPTGDTARLLTTLTPIEDFDTLADGPLYRFCARLADTARRTPVRIAVLGDSFIEGDILTADLREKLQQAYGGGGAGFAPMASPLTAFRRTIKTQSKGWTAYNIMQRKAAPQNLRGHFFVSGWVCQPSEGASTRWENTDYRQRLDSCTAARVFFISPGDSRIELTLNDSLRREFEVEGAAAVRQVTVTAPHIRSLAFKVNSGTEGFIGYGAVFEADGVVVDNYSVRSNNGQAMFWTNPSVNAQINAHAGYDLVILQYGLNIMQTGVHNYTNYARQIEKMVVYVQQCFPTAAVLVLGVSDRSVKTDAGFEPMDAIPYMLDYQRGAAENTGAAFWPTCDAMRSLGGMEQFVANGWAGKDYTHINYAGGRRVAWSLVDAINAGAYEAHAAAEAARIRRQAEQAVLDSVRLLKIDRELRPVSAIGNLNTPRK